MPYSKLCLGTHQIATLTGLGVKESISIISPKVTHWNKRPSWGKCDMKTRDRGTEGDMNEEFCERKATLEQVRKFW